MDRRPIGVFDSGLGGLTAVRELARLMPEEDLIYFGDTGRVPYGGRSQDTITTYARQDVRFLRSFDPKAIVIAWRHCIYHRLGRAAQGKRHSGVWRGGTGGTRRSQAGERWPGRTDRH